MPFSMVVAKALSRASVELSVHGPFHSGPMERNPRLNFGNMHHQARASMHKRGTRLYLCGGGYNASPPLYRPLPAAEVAQVLRRLHELVDANALERHDRRKAFGFVRHIACWRRDQPVAIHWQSMKRARKIAKAATCD